MVEASPGEWVTDFKSSFVARFRWGGSPNDEKAPLNVAIYNNGEIITYRYESVPMDIYKRLCEEAENSHKDGSVGKVVNNRLKDNYDYTAVGEHQAESKPETIVPR